MTVLFLSRLFYPHIGGVEKHVLEISKILVSKGHKVIIISENSQESHSTPYQSDSPSARPVGKLKNLESYNINPGKDDWFKKFRIWKQLWKHRDLIRSADVVHCHDVFFWYLPFRFLFLTKPVYTTFHGYEGNNIPNKKAIFMHKLSEKLSYGNICVGDFLKKWYGTKPTFITYGAVDLQTINKYITENKNTKKFNDKVIFFGRLENETGIMKYLEALKILKKKGISLELDIYGEGSLKEGVIKYKKENNLKINLKGFIMNIESVLNNYEYVFCSRYLSILESMAFRKPIFAEYNNAIKKDYLQMAPFAEYISISKDANEIAQNLEEFILGRKKLMVENAYTWVKTETWDKMADTYLKLWSYL